MEILGILFSIPVAFVLSTVYCLFLDKVVSKHKELSRWSRYSAYLVLSLFFIEIALLIVVGAVRSRGLLGPIFYQAHICLFFLTPPALGTVLVLQQMHKILSKLYIAAILCTAFTFFMVLLQYGVSESLYGVDGENGPYSEIVPLQPQNLPEVISRTLQSASSSKPFQSFWSNHE